MKKKKNNLNQQSDLIISSISKAVMRKESFHSDHYGLINSHPSIVQFGSPQKVNESNPELRGFKINYTY